MRKIMLLAVLFCLSLLPFNTGAQENVANTLPYQMPPPEIAALIDAPYTPFVDLSPDRQWLLVKERPLLLTLDVLAQDELKLAGKRINPATNGPTRVRYYHTLYLKNTRDSSEVRITGLPDDPKVDDVSWAPDSEHIAFTLTQDNGIELWAADVATGQARKLTEPRLNAAYATPYNWVSDSHTLLCKFVPSDRDNPPPAPAVPIGPVIQENSGKAKPARTYQDMLSNAHDEALFEYYFQSQMATVTLDGQVREIGPVGIHKWAEPAPGGEYLLVETIHRPFSYQVPAYRFPTQTEVWDMDGQRVEMVYDAPLADDIPISYDAVQAGPRYFSWRADVPATLVWVVAQDGGDPEVETDVRDEVFMWEAPFEADPVSLIKLEERYAGITWGDGDLALVSERWWKTRHIRTWRVHPDQPQQAPQVLSDRSWEDRYNDPGSPMTRESRYGTRVLFTADDGQTIFLEGEGASPEGNRPFVDRMDLASGETTRLWRSEAPYYEYSINWLDVDARTLLTRRESISEQPNYFIRDLAADTLTQLTEFPHPTPQLSEVKKELIQYQRADSVALNGMLYLPPGYDPATDGTLPVLVWAYPREFKDADAAGQVTDSPYRFVRVGWWSPLLWLTMGYAILDDPTMPIVGEGDAQPNDTYVAQLVASGQAAVDALVERGISDGQRVAIGGHSYGAFMAANLLAHSNVFRAGIARSGAYNRTLTPFGFQAEERIFWEAPDTYFEMSPFMHADKINEPLLLIHGAMDSNSGTYPMQSERFYEALQGLGATARLVMLPHESHSYRARASIMHMAWEMTNWLEKYVKNNEVE